MGEDTRSDCQTRGSAEKSQSSCSGLGRAVIVWGEAGAYHVFRMPFHSLNLLVLPGTFAVCRLGADASVPAWATAGPIFSVTRTADELSIVCEQPLVPEGVRSERDWHCFRVAGEMPFTMVGVLASLVGPLADEGISVFAVSTFDTDYVLVKEADLERAQQALRQAGHSFV